MLSLDSDTVRVRCAVLSLDSDTVRIRCAVLSLDSDTVRVRCAVLSLDSDTGRIRCAVLLLDSDTVRVWCAVLLPDVEGSLLPEYGNICCSVDGALLPASKLFPGIVLTVIVNPLLGANAGRFLFAGILPYVGEFRPCADVLLGL